VSERFYIRALSRSTYVTSYRGFPERDCFQSVVPLSNLVVQLSEVFNCHVHLIEYLGHQNDEYQAEQKEILSLVNTIIDATLAFWLVVPSRP
jgi:hypothetical protein